MKLQDKFFKAFFYPFLIGISASIIISVVILFYYSNDYLDKKNANDIYKMEKKYATININSVNVLLTDALLQVLVGFHEQLFFYQNISSGITDRSKNSIGKDIYNVVNITIDEARKNYASVWFVDRDTLKVTDKSSDLYQQIATFSQLTQSLYSALFSINNALLNIFFLFEKTNLIIAYPYSYYENQIRLNIFYEYNNNPTWCTDDKGNIINYYKFKCRDFYFNMLKAKEDLFDSNVNNQKNRKIFISTPYHQFGVIENEIIVTMCIQFNDIISNNNAYICGDINVTNLFDSFDDFNEKLIGYFTITSIGFNNAFYYPQISSSGYGKTLSEYIFRWDKDYYLEEKLDFVNIIQKNMTSNYFDKIDGKIMRADPLSIFNEVYIDNKNGENQYFYLNKEKYNYCIFPIILDNYKRMPEHVLNIIYIYNKKLYYQQMFDYQNETSSKIVLQLIIFIFFGFVLLYLIAYLFDYLQSL